MRYGSEQEEGTVLRNLHTLDGVVNLKLTKEVCKRMANLKKLRVRYDLFCDEYDFQNLGLFNKLKSLRISFDDDSKWCDTIPTLTLPTLLEELHLINCHLGWEDLTRMISSPLPHLGLLQVNLSGTLTRSILLLDCEDLIHWNANSSHFPALETLVLHNIPKLSEIPLDIGDIPTLRFIMLSGCCGAPAAVSTVKIVMEQEADYGNHDYLQLYVQFQKDNHQEFKRFREMLKEDEGGECLTSNNIQIC